MLPPRSRAAAVDMRDEGLVVRSSAVRAGRVQHADDGERNAVDRDRLTDRVRGAEQLLGGRRAEHGDGRRRRASAAVRNRPVGDRARAHRSQSGVVPTTVVVQFWSEP